MQKIKIRLPGTLTNFGPGISSLGLAIGLYVHVDITPRNDHQLIVDTSGEGSGYYAIGLRHPVVLGMMRVFQQLERAPLGIHIRIDSQIPPNSGLGTETAFMCAGIIAANNLMGNPYNRHQIIEFAARHTHNPPAAIAAIVGGLTASFLDDEEQLYYRHLPIQPFRLIVAIPQLDKFKRPAKIERVPLDDAKANLQRLPLLLEAFRTGDMKLLSRVIDDKLHVPFITANITGYAHISEMVRVAGALAITTSGDGPVMVIFADKGYERITEVIEIAFKNIGVPVQVWTLPIDTQGVVISMMQSG